MENFRSHNRSFTRLTSLGNQEPLIVVEESNLSDEEEPESSDTPSNKGSMDINSPVNPYLLSPWRDARDARKHSLPSQQVTEGITASQVRRLSERGGEGSGPTPREAAFLATLSQATAPSGRRHSVVTISKVPFEIFGRMRRESVAAIPQSNRVLGSRRESTASAGPPSTDPLGSIHNLQLDIMDDIVQSRKARMKLWTSSNEKMSEIKTNRLETETPHFGNRRFSECVTPTLAITPSLRRASVQPTIISPSNLQASTNTTTATPRTKVSGLLGSRPDLNTIFNSLTSSAMEINKCEDSKNQKNTSQATPSINTNFLDPNAGRSTRSNSFDIAILNSAKQMVAGAQDNSATVLTGWFAKRHEPMERKKSVRSKSTAVALSKEMLERLQAKDVLRESKPKLKPRSKQKTWSEQTKEAIVDATSIGSAIQGFLNKNTPTMPTSGSTTSHTAPASAKSSGRGAIPKQDYRSSSRKSRTQQATNAVRNTLNWFGKSSETNSKSSCDTSLCSTLKDLFVK